MGSGFVTEMWYWRRGYNRLTWDRDKKQYIDIYVDEWKKVYPMDYLQKLRSKDIERRHKKIGRLGESCRKKNGAERLKTRRIEMYKQELVKRAQKSEKGRDDGDQG